MDDTMERAWVTTPMSPEMRVRIKKAAAHNKITMAAYMRMAVTTYMQRQGEWSLRGPQKGA